MRSRLLLENLPAVASDERFDVELSFASIVVHVSDFSEHCALSPALVVDSSDAPHAAHVAVRIATV